MKFYLRNFLFILFVSFGSLFCWLIYTLSPNNNELPSANVIRSHRQNQPKNFDPENIPRRKKKPPISEINHQNVTKATPERSFKKIRNIQCKINGEYKVNCLKLITEKEISVYVPFSLIHKYFEINGKILNAKTSDEYFEWSHSYSKIFYPDAPYESTGKFLWFGNYNVEFRDRVKCISGVENVPISTQWHPEGHLYPTQICQYGLSHFNKNISDQKPQSIRIVDDGVIQQDSVDPELSNLDSTFKKNYLLIKNGTLNLTKNRVNFLIGQTEMKILGNDASISFVVMDISNQRTLKTVYSAVNETIKMTNNSTVTYGIGSDASKRGWFKFTRDLLVDLFKGNLISERKRSIYFVSQIIIDGPLCIRNFRLKTLAHDDFALAAGDWLVRNQNELGGWNIKVKRKLSGGALVIQEGWHSAMAQGHAISLLTRLYRATNRDQYLDSAKKALSIFDIESYKNGVKAILFDKFVWYEEYPTVPSIFVLNGFIYSLFGLYDLSKSCQDEHCKKSGQLYEDGIRSLEAALPLYDSGSGSFYDLRHLSLGIAPNIARWDYHSTHINQLLFLYTIARNDLFHTTAQRWIGYMKGHRASHN